MQSNAGKGGPKHDRPTSDNVGERQDRLFRGIDKSKCAASRTDNGALKHTRLLNNNKALR